MKKFVRIVSAVLVLVMSAGLVMGCSKEKPKSVKAEKEKITLWYYWSQSYNKEELACLVDGFNHFQNKIEVVTQYVPDEDFKKRLALSMADGVMPDLALVDSADFKYFHAMRPFVDLTDEIDGIEEYLPEVKKACTIEGRMMGMPYGMDSTVLFYNQDILDDYGAAVPKTWQELLDTSAALSDSKHCGFAMPALSSEESVYNFLPLLWSMGGDVDSLDSKEGRSAFQYLRQLTDEAAMSRQTINLTAGDLVRQFVEGNIAMMVNSTNMIDSVNTLNPALKYGVAQLPAAGDGKRVSVLGGEVFGVTKGAHQKAAIQFLKYLSDKDRMSSYMEHSSYMAPRRDVLEKQYQDNPLKRSVAEWTENARTREFSVEWPYISLIITNAMEQEIIGEKDENVILRNAAQEVADVRRGIR